jgi:hypothetical protein
VLSCEPVKGDSLEFGVWSTEFGGSGSGVEQYSLEPAVNECSSQAERT